MASARYWQAQVQKLIRKLSEAIYKSRRKTVHTGNNAHHRALPIGPLYCYIDTNSFT